MSPGRPSACNAEASRRRSAVSSARFAGSQRPRTVDSGPDVGSARWPQSSSVICPLPVAHGHMLARWPSQPEPAGTIFHGATLDTGETATRLAQLVVPRLADWATVMVIGTEGAGDQTARAHRDPARLAHVDSYVGGRRRGARDMPKL